MHRYIIYQPIVYPYRIIKIEINFNELFIIFSFISIFIMYFFFFFLLMCSIKRLYYNCIHKYYEYLINIAPYKLKTN